MLSETYKKGKESLRCLISLLLVVGIAAAPVMADETATLSIKSIPNVNIRMYGFIENDLVNDSTQGIGLEPDNPAVPKPLNATGTLPNWAGNHHQTIMSVQNSRLGFDVTMPKSDSGIDTEGIFEFDFLGAGNYSAQRDIYNNPVVRIRHAYLNITDGQFNGKIGQTWSLLGWQPYYFPSEATVQPAAGQLYRRFDQLRFMDTQKFNLGSLDEWTLESAIDAARPPEVNSGVPMAQAGLRLASTKYKALSGLGSSTPMVGASLAVSGDLIPLRTNAYGNATGNAVAIDALIPIIPSKDGKDPSNTLGLTSEYSNGRGYGGLELANASAGITTVTDGTTATGDGALDTGMAGLSGLNIDLIHLATWRSNLTYMWPGAHWANSIGYAETQCFNVGQYAVSTSDIYRYQYYYANVMWLPMSWLRFALQWGQYKDTYNDANNRYAYNNRIQFTTYLTF